MKERTVFSIIVQAAAGASASTAAIEKTNAAFGIYAETLNEGEKRLFGRCRNC